MAMFAALGDKFICGILKQVAADYSLDYKEMKAKYTGAKSFDLFGPSDHTEKEIEELDLETEPEIAPVKAKKTKEAKKKEPKKKETLKEAPKTKAKAKAVEPKAGPMALSKMKKQDLIDELEEQGIDTDKLTVAKLKELVKGAREQSGVVVAKGGRKAKAVKEVPVHNHEPLTEEPVEDCALCDTHGDILTEEPEAEFEVQNQETLEARLAAILAEANEDEEEDGEDEAEDGDGEAEYEEVLTEDDQ